MARRSTRQNSLSESDREALLGELKALHNRLCRLSAELAIACADYKACNAMIMHLHVMADQLSGQDGTLRQPAPRTPPLGKVRAEN